MKALNKKWTVIILLPLIFLLLSCGQKPVNLESLLDEMVDRDNIARLPEIPYTLGQFSSYDRESVGKDEPGWFANSDRTMFIRDELNGGRKEYVMMDAKGPGAVVRFWMTFAGPQPGKGTLRIYFDGQAEPVIEGSALEVLSGDKLVGEPLASSVSDLAPYDNRGHNLYLPLPYAESCKITYESNNITTPGNKGNTGESVYYNINYRTYPEGTQVTTFSMEELEAAKEKVEMVQQKLLARDRGPGEHELTVEEIDQELSPDEQWSAEFSGSRAVRYIKMTLDAGNLPQALRTTIVEAEFDGEKTVWAPVGDFFGTGYQIRHLNTWYAEVKEDGSMHAYWVMPFEKNARLILRNIGDQKVGIAGEIALGDWDWDGRSMHFGASWKQFTGIFTREGLSSDSAGAPFDLNYVELTGDGVYAGDGLALFNTSYIWWGEGDEKIYVDGENFPSHFGTGTEDYFGYAWGGRSMRFTNHPLIAQPDETGNAKPGYVVNLRYRALDALPFRKNLKVDMEMWHWHATWMNYAPVAYYYMRPGGKTNATADEKGAQAKVALQSSDIIPNEMINGTMEAEHMVFSNSCGNKRGSMSINPFGDIPLSGNLQVMWNDGAPGDTIFFSFESPEEGLFPMTGDFTAGPGFGNFRCLLNEKQIHRGFSLTAGQREKKSITFGNVHIKQGKNSMSFILGPGERRNRLFGFDRIMVNKKM